MSHEIRTLADLRELFKNNIIGSNHPNHGFAVALDRAATRLPDDAQAELFHRLKEVSWAYRLPGSISHIWLPANERFVDARGSTHDTEMELIGAAMARGPTGLKDLVNFFRRHFRDATDGTIEHDVRTFLLTATEELTGRDQRALAAKLTTDNRLYAVALAWPTVTEEEKRRLDRIIDKHVLARCVQIVRYTLRPNALRLQSVSDMDEAAANDPTNPLTASGRGPMDIRG